MTWVHIFILCFFMDICLIGNPTIFPHLFMVSKLQSPLLWCNYNAFILYWYLATVTSLLIFGNINFRSLTKHWNGGVWKIKENVKIFRLVISMFCLLKWCYVCKISIIGKIYTMSQTNNSFTFKDVQRYNMICPVHVHSMTYFAFFYL